MPVAAALSPTQEALEVPAPSAAEVSSGHVFHDNPADEAWRSQEAALLESEADHREPNQDPEGNNKEHDLPEGEYDDDGHGVGDVVEVRPPVRCTNLSAATLR